MVTSVFNSFIFLLLVMSMPLAAFSSLTSEVDKNPALAGEAITLVVTADSRLSADALNYRQLEQNFRVMAPSVSQSRQIINGQSSQSTRWSLTLFPLNSGVFTIPAFEINGIRSLPLTVEVLDQPIKKDASRELFVEANLIATNNVYVQQMLYYDVVIYFSGDLQRGTLTEPQLEGAEIKRVGQDAEGSAIVNGVRYRTITRRYSVIPQRSGDMVINPPVFTGEVIDRDNSNYNYFARSKTVMQEANPITLQVLPQPDNFPGNWLVAGLVTLTEEWQPNNTELVVGEPVTRIITLSAVDVSPSQLPELSQQLPAQLRSYDEQPQSVGAERNGRLVAQKVFTTALIANAEGEVTLPEISLAWWNSQTDQLQTTVLPARTFKVIAAAGATPTANTLPAPMATTPSVASNPWQWNYTSSLISLLWLASMLIALYFLKSRSAQPAALNTVRSAKVMADNRLLQQACAVGDAATAAQQLLLWGQQQFGTSIRSLGQLMGHLQDEALLAELKQLEQQLYSNTDSPWQGNSLYQQWRQWQAPAKQHTPQGLASLYP
ncbi:BatD family protein [Alishewanella sp. HL-SH05]|uniref:BatD family protein n=1 Tax=Alishewanella sp. HL-SH05 TaxID=3461145 RepID=UPI004042DD54